MTKVGEGRANKKGKGWQNHAGSKYCKEMFFIPVEGLYPQESGKK